MMRRRFFCRIACHWIVCVCERTRRRVCDCEERERERERELDGVKRERVGVRKERELECVKERVSMCACLYE